MQSRLFKGFFTIRLYPIMAILIFTALISLSILPVAQAGNSPLDTRMIAEMNKPGVIMIQTINKATIMVPDVQISQQGLEQLKLIMIDKVRRGEIENSQKAIAKAFVDEFLKNPAQYLQPNGQTITMQAQVGVMGTGFIVTPDGYILTSAHVVYSPEDELKTELAQAALVNQVNQDVKDFVKQVKNVYTPDENQVKALEEADFQYYAANMQLSNIQTSIYCGIGMAIPGIQTIQKGYACDLRKRGEPVPGKDVAILKIDKQNLPTVALGDDTVQNSGDSVYVLGYPGAATYNPLLDQNASAIESTFTSGLVSARKTMPGGWSILQMDAAITHGNSGGPVFNNQGEVIGIATFGSIDPNTHQEIQGMNFAVPISIAKQYLNELNVKPAESELTKNYKAALSLFHQEKYKQALKIFQEINAINPGYPYIQDFISQCTTNIEAGKDKSGDFTHYIIIGVIVLAVIGGGVAVVLLRKKFSFKIEAKGKIPAPTPVPDSTETQNQTSTPVQVPDALNRQDTLQQ